MNKPPENLAPPAAATEVEFFPAVQEARERIRRGNYPTAQGFHEIPCQQFADYVMVVCVDAFLNPPDRSQMLTAEWIKETLPPTVKHGRRSKNIYKFGRIDWSSGAVEESFVVWLNGEILPWAEMTRQQLMNILKSLEGV